MEEPCEDKITFTSSFHNLEEEDHEPPNNVIVSKVSKDDSIDTHNSSKTPELELEGGGGTSPHTTRPLNLIGPSLLRPAPDRKATPTATTKSTQNNNNNPPEKHFLPTLGDDWSHTRRNLSNFRSFDTTSSSNSNGTTASSSGGGYIRSLSEDIDTIPQFKLHRRTKSFSDISKSTSGSHTTPVIKRKRIITKSSSTSEVSPCNTSYATSSQSFDDSPSSTVTGSPSPYRKLPPAQQPLPHSSPPPRSPNSKRRFIPNSSNSHSPKAHDLTHPLSTVERCAEDVPPWIIHFPDGSSPSTQIPLMPMSMLLPNGHGAAAMLRRRPPLPPSSASLPNVLNSPPDLKRTSQRYEEEERIVFDLTLLEREDRLRKLRASEYSFGSSSLGTDTREDEEEFDGRGGRVNLNRRQSFPAHFMSAPAEERLMGESIAFSTSDEEIIDDDDQDLAGIEFLSQMLDIDGDDGHPTHHVIPRWDDNAEHK